MRFLKELFPSIIFETTTSFSGEVRVVEFHGERRLIVGGLVQSLSSNSPHLHQKVWGRLASPSNLKKDSEILVLGLGGGTVAHLLSKKFHPKRIVGVEADPVVAEIGRRFFGLEKVRNLEVVVGDAKNYVDAAAEKFNFIIVDAYQGSRFPPFLESFNFLRGLKYILKDGGELVFNRIFKLSQPRAKEFFGRRLGKIFGSPSEEVIEGPADEKNYLFWIRF